MKKILLIGAGKSSGYLIDYLLQHAVKDSYELTVADLDIQSALKKTQNRPHSKVISFNMQDNDQRENLIRDADVVISMLPAFMHMPVAKDCVRLKKHLVTASYVSSEISALHNEALQQDVLLLNETGLDPGIDHMSAMHIIDQIKEKQGTLYSFKSYCGGLVAPESNSNPWGYKFSWNPRNVIVAGQSTAQYLENGGYKFLPYQRLFASAEIIEVDGYGKFDAYANRDSLSYRKVYGIENVATILRGTLRQHPYCEAWNVFVMLGLTDDSFEIDLLENYTYADFFSAFLPIKGQNLEESLCLFLNKKTNDEIVKMIQWTGILENRVIGLKKASPAVILQKLLEEKWKLEPQDKDMVVMQHIFEYKNSSQKKKQITSTLVVLGENSDKTAMAKTVGLPMAIMVRKIINGQIKLRGVQIPVMPELYQPVLDELSQYGIVFQEKELEIE